MGELRALAGVVNSTDSALGSIGARVVSLSEGLSVLMKGHEKLVSDVGILGVEATKVHRHFAFQAMGCDRGFEVDNSVDWHIAAERDRIAGGLGWATKARVLPGDAVLLQPAAPTTPGVEVDSPGVELPVWAGVGPEPGVAASAPSVPPGFSPLPTCSGQPPPRPDLLRDPSSPAAQPPSSFEQMKQRAQAELQRKKDELDARLEVHRVQQLGVQQPGVQQPGVQQPVVQQPGVQQPAA